MLSFLRSARAVFAGALVAFLVIAVCEMLSARLYPLPAGLDVHNREAMSNYVATLPLTAFLILLLSYGLGGLGGGFIAARLAPSAPPIHARAIAVFLVVASVVNLLSIEHPVWFWAANLVVVILLPPLGGRLAQRGAVHA